MTAAEVTEMSVTNSLSQNYANMDNLSSPTCTDSPWFKPFTLSNTLFELTASNGHGRFWPVLDVSS